MFVRFFVICSEFLILVLCSVFSLIVTTYYWSQSIHLTFAEEWNSILRDFSEFDLGVLSIVIDVMYMFQHYVLYATPEYKRVPDDDLVINDVTNYPVIV